MRITLPALLAVLAISTVLPACSPAIPKPPLAYPEEIASWTADEMQQQREAAARILADLTKAAAAGKKRFVIPPGDYRFGPGGPENLHLKNAGDLEIEATGATFWLYPFQRKDGILFENCRNVTLRGLTVDYFPKPFPQGKVTEVNAAEGYIEFHLDPGYSSPFDIPSKTVGGKIVHFTPEGELLPSRLDWVKDITAAGEGRFRVFPRGGWAYKYPAGIVPGTRLALADRSMRMAFNLKDSDACKLEDITVHATPHMAFTEHFGAGGHTYSRCRVVRRPGTNGLLASNADVFHSVAVTRGPTIEDCEFSYAADDLINIHGLLSLVFEQRKPDNIDLVTQLVSSFPVGTELRFYAHDSFTLKATAKVLRSDSVDIAERISAATELVASKKIAFLKPARVVRITLDRPIEVERTDFVTSDDRVARGTIIRNNNFHDCYTRGVLLKTIGGLIENNRFDNMGIASIGVALDAHFMESPFPSDIIIRGNTISRNGYNNFVNRNDWNCLIGAISVTCEQASGLPPNPTSTNIRILENTVLDSASAGILMTNVARGEIVKNTVRLFHNAPPDPIAPPLGGRMQLLNPTFAIILARCENIRLEGNIVEQPGAFAQGGIAFFGRVSAAGPQKPDAWNAPQP